MLTKEDRKAVPQRPPDFTCSLESIRRDTERLVERSRGVQDDIVRSVQPPATATFANTILPLAQNQNQNSLESQILTFHQQVSTDPAVRSVSNEAKQQLNNFRIQTYAREDLFVRIAEVLNKSNSEDLDVESRLLLEQEHRRFVSNGLGLPTRSERDSFKDIKKRLSELCVDFQQNLNEEKSGIYFSHHELDGVPDDVLERLVKGKIDSENKNKLRVTFQYPDYFPVMDYARNSETRKRLFIAYENKNNGNVRLLEEAVILRDKAARLLGYPNHAAFRLKDKMIKSPQAINTFLEDLRSRLAGKGRQEIQRLKQLKQINVGVEHYNGRYYLWDHRFYSRMMRETECSIDQRKVAEYFPLNETIAAMLRIFALLFGLVFDTNTGESGGCDVDRGRESIVWHEDVSLFTVWDDEAEGGGFVGYLYMDLYPRDGKYGHAANFSLQPGFLNADGSRRYPATALVCNFTKPTQTKPSLLKHEEVVLLFHELGHGIHDLVSRTKYAQFHGTRTVQDFCEAPSQMLENWCWQPSQLELLSQHYVTGEKIPDVMVQSLINAKGVNKGLFHLRQLHVSIFDMMIHQPNSLSFLERSNISEIYNSLWEEITGLEGPNTQGTGQSWGHGEATFFHLMGDYDAGYYGYLVSNIYALDMFHTVFAPDPTSTKQGRRYRHLVLEKGGSQPELKTLTDFLGREPKMDAFYEELGLPVGEKPLMSKES